MKKIINDHRVPIIISVVGIIGVFIYSVLSFYIDDGMFAAFSLVIPFLVLPLFLTILWIGYFIIKLTKDFDSRYIIASLCVPFVVFLLCYLLMCIESLALEIISGHSDLEESGIILHK